MSRHTRMLRKQAKAAATAQAAISTVKPVSPAGAPVPRPPAGGPFEGPAITNLQARLIGLPETPSTVHVGANDHVITQIRADLREKSERSSPPPAPPFPQLEGWIWPGRIRCGELVVVVGESGAGASTLTADWIARLTCGMAFPGCRPQDHHPVADVLLFNTLEDFSRTVLPRVAEMGGNPGRVLLASEQLLAWGAGQVPGDQPPREGREAQTKVRLHTAAALEQLDKLLKRRPGIRLVVIDQLKLFLRTDSERVFEGLIHELTTIARTNDVAIVLTQAPDAFRKSGGPARYLKSPSLVQCARSIWRLVASEEDRFGDRVLDCLKLSHPVRKEKPGPWHLRLPEFGPLEWVRGNGGSLLASTASSHELALKTACKLVERVLQVCEGKTTWTELVSEANLSGVEIRWLREAILKMKLDSAFDILGQQQITRYIGHAEDLVVHQRKFDIRNSPTREDFPLHQQRQLDPPLRWGDEEPDWDDRFDQAAADTSRVPHRNELAAETPVEPAAATPAAAHPSGQTPATPTGTGSGTTAGNPLRFIKPNFAQREAAEAELGAWDRSADLAEASDEVDGWEDGVATPVGPLAGAL